MKANPGGKIPIDAIIGRAQIIEVIWDTLEQQSVIKTAERRIGKTTIATKMLGEPREGWAPIFQDLERYHTANDFAVSVYRHIDSFLSGKQRVARRAKELFKTLGGGEVSGVFKIPTLQPSAWKDILTCSIQDLSKDREDKDDRLLFLWDEMPYMLEHIRDREGEATALEVLDVLRGLRQEFDLRMVITGSIGIHHVLQTLSKKAAASVNDLYQIEIPPLTQNAAAELANKLIRGEALPCENPEEVAAIIAQETDGFAFYIHHVVKALKMKGCQVTEQSARDIVSEHLTDDNDPWELHYFRKRLVDYYPNDEKTTCLILDELSLRNEPMPPNDLMEYLKNVSVFDDRERLLELLKSLVQDHYLKREPSGNYRFRFSLIKRWWSLSRGLSS